MAYRIANVTWGVLFLLATAVQINDPDPFRWMFVYGLAATMCALAVRGELPERPALGYGVVSGLLAVSTLFTWAEGGGQPMEGAAAPGFLGDEVFREAMGLCLVSGWMLALWAWTRRLRQDRPSS